MCIKIKVSSFKDESILNSIYVTEKTSITCNGSLIQEFVTYQTRQFLGL